MKLKLPSRRKAWTPGLSEIHEYTLDLQRISMLRDKCDNDEERKRYTECITVMQEVLIFLNTEPAKRET